MEKQVLSLEQMKRLELLGVDLSDASMCWYIDHTGTHLMKADKYNHAAWKANPPKLYQREFSFHPAFTLQDILEIMPYDIFGNYNFWLMKSNGGYKFSVKNNPDSAKIGTHFYDNPLEAAYDILIWFKTSK